MDATVRGGRRLEVVADPGVWMGTVLLWNAAAIAGLLITARYYQER